MSLRVRGSDDLGVVGCDYVATGESPGDVAQDMIEHLRSEHDVDMPDADRVTSDEEIETSTAGAHVIVKRLRNALDISGVVTTVDQEPVTDTVVPPGDMPGNL